MSTRGCSSLETTPLTCIFSTKAFGTQGWPRYRRRQVDSSPVSGGEPPAQGLVPRSRECHPTGRIVLSPESQTQRDWDEEFTAGAVGVAQPELGVESAGVQRVAGVTLATLVATGRGAGSADGVGDTGARLSAGGCSLMPLLAGATAVGVGASRGIRGARMATG